MGTLLPAARASGTELACVAGHNTVVPPCTFDGGVLSLDSANFTSGLHGGHHALVSFPNDPAFGPGIQNAADIAGGNPPFMASDSTTSPGVSSGSLTLTFSTIDGAHLIDALRFSLINPVVIGTGSITWSFGSVSGDQTTSSGELDFAPVSSITETFAGSLIAGASGDAAIDGFRIDLRLVPVPEPSTLSFLGSGLVALGILVRRGRRQEMSRRRVT